MDFLARETGRVDIEMMNISSVKMDGQVLSTNEEKFAMNIVEGEIYHLECVITAKTVNGVYHIETVDNVTTVEKTNDYYNGTPFVKGDILIWFNFSEGTEHNPYIVNSETQEITAVAEDSTFIKIEENGVYTFTFTGLTATLNGETAITSGTKCKLVADDVIKFVNADNAANIAFTFEATIGDVINPLLLAELQNGTFTVEGGATYYVKVCVRYSTYV